MAPTQSALTSDGAAPIFVDNTNLSELKATCDEAVERILCGKSDPSSARSHAAFAPFKPNHFHTDLRLVLGFSASAVMIGTSVWAYFIEKEWARNKQACAVAVVIYMALSSIQLIDAYLQGHNIFLGTRKILSKRIETESLKIASPPLPKATKQPNEVQNGRPVLTPPSYMIEVDYSRKTNKGKSLLARKKDPLLLGHMGEWFTEEGEFVQSIFEQRLISGLQKIFGQ